MPPSPIARSSKRSGQRGPAISCLSKPTSPNSRPRSRTPSATIPPTRVAALPGASNRRVDPPDLERAETIDKGHGRIEIRGIAVRPPPSRLHQNRPGPMPGCRIEGHRQPKTRCERQIIYAITDLPKQAASADRLLDLSRAHWGIENRSFRVKDGTFAEDACRVRSGNAPIARAPLRDYTLALIRRRGGKPKPAREAFAATTAPPSAPSSPHELNGPGPTPGSLWTESASRHKPNK